MPCHDIVRRRIQRLGDILQIDAVLAALTTASESRRALSRLAGALLDAYSALGIDAPKLRTYAAAIAQGLAQGHPAGVVPRPRPRKRRGGT